MTLSNDLIRHSSANRKVVLLVSDMLENSETLSFYKNGSVSIADPYKAYNIFARSVMSGDFSQASIYVIGAGFIEKGAKYSSQQAVNKLELFWAKLFEAHQGELMHFGKPSLFAQIQ